MNRGSSTWSSTLARSGAEVAGVELVDGTNLGKAGEGGWSATTMGDASPSGGTRRERAAGARAVQGRGWAPSRSRDVQCSALSE
jgi:hypothetical protein